MTNLLIHRGPHEDGYFVDGPIGFGMRRLSIIDVAGGHQPVKNEDESVIAVFNGEIYNYRELAADLESRGHVFRTRSDSEVIVHAYEEMGDNCVQAFNGMFAFALWDAKRRRLLIARDRLGVKPLYYAETRGGLAFASELKSLLALASISREVDPTFFSDYLTLMYGRAPRSPFRAIRKLPPGHLASVDEGGVFRMSQYWNLADFPEGSIDPPEREIEDKIAELLTDSIRLRLRSDVPVGAFLSGGLDSSAIVALAAPQMKAPLNTFSVGFGGDSFEELDYARSVATMYSTAHHETIVGVEDAIQHLPLLLWHLDEPNADSAIVPTYLVSRYAAQFLHVVLAGIGGDELFGGYPRYFDGPPLEHAFRRIPVSLQRRIALPMIRRVHPSLGGKLARNAETLSRRYMTRVQTFPPDALRAIVPQPFDPGATLEAEFAAYRGRDPVNHVMYVDAVTYLPDDILHLTDRMSMAVSIEARTPFLDYRLVEYCFSLSGREKVRQISRGWKIALKRAMKGRVPESILTRPKWGFGGPVQAWMQKGLQDVVVRLYRNSAAVDHGLVDARVHGRLVPSSVRPPRDAREAQQWWSLLVLEIWARIFLSGDPSSAPSFTLADIDD